MRDSQGHVRGNCQEDGCICVEYVRPSNVHRMNDARGEKCDYCGHLPISHVALSIPEEVTPSTIQKVSYKESFDSESNSHSTFSNSGRGTTTFSSSTTTTATSTGNSPRVVATAVSSRRIEAHGLSSAISNSKRILRDLTKKKKA